MPKTNTKSGLASVITAAARRHARGGVFVVAILLIGVLVVRPLVNADEYDNAVRDLQVQNIQNQQAASRLQAQANSYEEVVAKLQGQIQAVEQQIAANQAKSADLQKQIAAAEVELAKQRDILGQDIKVMYLDSDTTTLEMLAASKDLSEYFDRQQYREIVQDKIKSSLDKILALKNQLKTQKAQVEQLIKDEGIMRAQLSADHDEQNRLLQLTKDQKAAYTASIKANNEQIATLRAQQAAAYRAVFGGASSTGGTIVYRNLTGQQLCGGGYNFHCAETQDAFTDYWGLWNRECVSYTAWYQGTVRGKAIPYHFFAGVGNANQWEGDLLRNPNVGRVFYPGQINFNGAAVVGDIVYMPIGSLGHVGAVLRDLGDGWIRVGQYNLYEMGMYSEMDLKITSNLMFFHFN